LYKRWLAHRKYDKYKWRTSTKPVGTKSLILKKYLFQLLQKMYLLKKCDNFVIKIVFKENNLDAAAYPKMPLAVL